MQCGLEFQVSTIVCHVHRFHRRKRANPNFEIKPDKLIKIKYQGRREFQPLICTMDICTYFLIGDIEPSFTNDDRSTVSALSIAQLIFRRPTGIVLARFLQTLNLRAAVASQHPSIPTDIAI